MEAVAFNVSRSVRDNRLKHLKEFVSIKFQLSGGK